MFTYIYNDNGFSLTRILITFPIFSLYICVILNNKFWLLKNMFFYIILYFNVVLHPIRQTRIDVYGSFLLKHWKQFTHLHPVVSVTFYWYTTFIRNRQTPISQCKFIYFIPHTSDSLERIQPKQRERIERMNVCERKCVRESV